MYVRDVLMWGAFICGVGAIPILLAMNAVDERAAMAPPPAARAMSGAPSLPLPGEPPPWTAPVASTTRDMSTVREPARTGTVPARISPAPPFADSLGDVVAQQPARPSRGTSPASTADSVPLPRPGGPRDPRSSSSDAAPSASAAIASTSDAPSTASGTMATDVQVPTGKEPGADKLGSPQSAPEQNVRASIQPAPSDQRASAPAGTGEPGRPEQSDASSVSAAPSPEASRSGPGPAPVLPPVRPEVPAQAIPSDRVEFASQTVPQKAPELPKRRTSSSKRRKAPPASLPAIPLEQQFEWIQQ